MVGVIGFEEGADLRLLLLVVSIIVSFAFGWELRKRFQKENDNKKDEGKKWY